MVRSNRSSYPSGNRYEVNQAEVAMGAEVREHPCSVVASRHSRESGNPVLVPPRHARPFSKALWVPAFAGTTLGDAVDVTPLGGPAKAGTVTDQ